MSVLDRFLNTIGSVDGLSFDLVHPENPVDWRRLGEAVAGVFIGATALGIQRTTNAILGVPASLLTSFADWIGREARYFRFPGGRRQLAGPGLIETIEQGVYTLINSAWAPLTGLGWLAYPVAVAEVLAVLWMVNWSVAYAREEVL